MRLIMNDDELNLALGIYSNPGVYALLLGSGVSRSAAIPTGWEIVMDLIAKLQVLEGDTSEDDLAAWYRKKYGEDPDYSKILELVSPTQAERNAILHSYFEPTDEEREQGLKMPTAAHRSIASLVKDGYIKVIITTNFDRLIESALEEQGVTPSVVSTDDDISGVVPYTHSRCTLIKVNGDYLDTRIKNTKVELETYSLPLNSYLDRILDEFGLIVSGWSGEWDVALRKAIVKCPSMRFTTYWGIRHDSSPEAKAIIEHRRARTIHIESADKFFTSLYDHVASLKQIEPINLSSIQVTVGMVKRFLSEDKYEIRLHDFISEEIEKCRSEMDSQKFVFTGNIDKPGFQARMYDYENITKRIMAMLSAVSFFGKESHSIYISKAINRLAENDIRGGLVALISLHRYPALLISYCCGIASLANGKWTNLAAILTKTSIREGNKKFPAVKYLNVWEVFSNPTYKWVPRLHAEREYTPANEYLYTFLRDILKPYIPSETAYQDLFDIYEYLLALDYVDSCERTSTSVWGPLGCFSWRFAHRQEDGVSNPIDEFFSNGIALEENWGLLTAGVFGGSVERAVSARDKFGMFLKSFRNGKGM
jgi:hypothetical protein